MDPLKPSGPNPTQGITNLETKESLPKDGTAFQRTVTAVDAQPLMSGRFLGLHLEKEGIRGKIQILRHASMKTLWHLFTNQLQKLQHSQPAKFMEEASQLCATPKDWTSLFEAGERLRTQIPRQNDQIEGWQKVALGHMAGNANTSSVQSQTEHLGQIANAADKLSTGLTATDRHTQPGKGLNLMRAQLENIIPRADIAELHNIKTHLQTLNDAYKASETSPFLQLTQSVEQQIAARTPTETPDAPDASNTPMEPKVIAETQALTQNFKGAIKDLRRSALTPVTELPHDDDIHELTSMILDDPDNPQVWKEFTDSASELNTDQLRSLFRDIFTSRRDSLNVRQQLIFNILPNELNNQGLWGIYDEIALQTNTRNLIDFLEPLYRKDPDNIELKTRLLQGLMELESIGWETSTETSLEARHYERLYQEVLG